MKALRPKRYLFRLITNRENTPLTDPYTKNCLLSYHPETKRAEEEE